MNVLGSILSVTFPFFALVLCGYAATRRGWITLDTIPGLNFYVLYLALPAMLLRFAATTPIAKLLAPDLVVTHLLCALCMVVLTLVLSRSGGMGWNDASFGALVTAFPNSGFMGVPLLVASARFEVHHPQAHTTRLAEVFVADGHAVGKGVVAHPQGLQRSGQRRRVGDAALVPLQKRPSRFDHLGVLCFFPQLQKQPNRAVGLAVQTAFHSELEVFDRLCVGLL